MKHARPTVLYAAAVRDAMGVNVSPGAVLVREGRVVAAGEPGSLPEGLVQQAELIERPKHLMLPAMVNAHTHLELTSIGPQPFDPAGGFLGWVKMIRACRSELFKLLGDFPLTHVGDPALRQLTHDDLRRFRSVQQQLYVKPISKGIQLCLDAGVQAVGDITGDLDSDFGQNLQRAPYYELFGIQDDQHLRCLRKARRLGEGARVGLQPHAPYSVGPRLFESVVREAAKGRRICTHLAETMEECRFIAQGDGPCLDYLNAIGKWDKSYSEYYGQGLSPVEWMRQYLEAVASIGGWLVAHCNYVSDDDIAILADTNTSVAYCPLASEYFGHKDHRYRDMLDAGINVCLGTDSIVGTDPKDPQPLGLLSSMRRLYQRDQTDPDTLLAMATTHGAKALRLDEDLGTLQPGAPARFACIPIDPESSADPFVQVLTGQNAIEAISFDLPA